MEAKEARKIAEDALSGSRIQPWLESTLRAIKAAAEMGVFEARDPIPRNTPAHLVDPVIGKLRAMGYSVETRQCGYNESEMVVSWAANR